MADVVDSTADGESVPLVSTVPLQPETPVAIASNKIVVLSRRGKPLPGIEIIGLVDTYFSANHGVVPGQPQDSGFSAQASSTLRISVRHTSIVTGSETTSA